MKRILILTMLFASLGLKGQGFASQNADVESGCDTTVTEITIGTQTWMQKNLAVTNYNDATGIPKVTDNTAWATLTTPAYCWYNNDSATYATTYGALYNWYAVNTGKLCPTGWHVPTDAEWTTLTTYLGGKTVAGGKLKEIGTTHWTTPNTGAVNSVCFTALPGGYRVAYEGGFIDIEGYGLLWSSSEYNTTKAWGRFMDYNHSNVFYDSFYKGHGFSVRCIKD
jgi:uncharacterized protein (TIGR02145 family)